MGHLNKDESWLSIALVVVLVYFTYGPFYLYNKIRCKLVGHTTNPNVDNWCLRCGDLNGK